MNFRLVQMFSFTGDTVSTPSPPSGDLSRLGISERNLRHQMGQRPAGPSERARASHWVGVRGTAALKHGRNSLGVELDPAYCQQAASRLLHENTGLFGDASFNQLEASHAREKRARPVGS